MTEAKTAKSKPLNIHLPIKDYDRIIKYYVDTGEFINTQDFIRYLIKNHFKDLKNKNYSNVSPSLYIPTHITYENTAQ